MHQPCTMHTPATARTPRVCTLVPFIVTVIVSIRCVPVILRACHIACLSYCVPVILRACHCVPAGSCGEEGSGQCPLCGGGQCTGQPTALHAVHDHQNYSTATIVTLHLAVIVFVCVIYNNACIWQEHMSRRRQLGSS